MSSQDNRQDRFLTAAESREIDRRAIEQYRMAGIVLMENAGRGFTDQLVQRGIDSSRTVHICCGKGNNAGDGFVVARHLDLRGYDVAVHLFCDPAELTGDAAANFRILDRMNVTKSLCYQGVRAGGRAGEWSPEFRNTGWIIDALLGTGAHGNPRPPLDQAIRQINRVRADCDTVRVAAIDLPSGLDCDTGIPGEPCVRADWTCTFAAQKVGFLAETAQAYIGELSVQDIGCPGCLLGKN